MPELPEVETVRRVVGKRLIGRKVERVTLRNSKSIAFPDASSFLRGLEGHSFSRAERRGKFLILHLESGSKLVIHLRMTGSLYIATGEDKIEKHMHVTIYLDDASELRFVDPRRFGRLWLIAPGDDYSITGIDRLGLEPFDEALTLDYLVSKAGFSRRAIKNILLDQSIVSGIGNIYSDEILFSARINPMREARNLSREEWERIREEIPRSLGFFIEKNRTTLDEFREGKGRAYRNMPYLRVYGRGGKKCLLCGKTLMKSMIGGRSSVWCPCCQSYTSDLK